MSLNYKPQRRAPRHIVILYNEPPRPVRQSGQVSRIQRSSVPTFIRRSARDRRLLNAVPRIIKHHRAAQALGGLEKARHDLALVYDYGSWRLVGKCPVQVFIDPVRGSAGAIGGTLANNCTGLQTVPGQNVDIFTESTTASNTVRRATMGDRYYIAGSPRMRYMLAWDKMPYIGVRIPPWYQRQVPYPYLRQARDPSIVPRNIPVPKSFQLRAMPENLAAREVFSQQSSSAGYGVRQPALQYSVQNDWSRSIASAKQTAPQAPQRHQLRRPRFGEKEVKATVGRGLAILLKRAERVLDAVDMLEALYKALPREHKVKWKDTEYLKRFPSEVEMLNALGLGIQDINLEMAFWNIVIMELEDRLYGLAGQTQGLVGQRLNMPAGAGISRSLNWRNYHNVENARQNVIDGIRENL